MPLAALAVTQRELQTRMTNLPYTVTFHEFVNADKELVTRDRRLDNDKIMIIEKVKEKFQKTPKTDNARDDDDDDDEIGWLN